MTICIAAACDNGKSLILACDTEVGTGISKTQLSDSKWGSLCKNWSIGIAGTVAHATDVVTRATTSDPQSLASYDVRAAVENAYRQARMARVEAEYLASRGWTLQEFKDYGRAKLTEAVYSTIDARISLFDFGAELIVAGFAEDLAFPCIMTIKNPGVCVDHTRLGFWCVGSGATAAQMSLFSRNYSYLISPEEAAYYVYEAKIAAEHASGVGKETTMYLVRKDETSPAMPFSDVAEHTLDEILKELKPHDLTEAHQAALRTLPDFARRRRKSKSAKRG